MFATQPDAEGIVRVEPVVSLLGGQVAVYLHRNLSLSWFGRDITVYAHRHRHRTTGAHWWPNHEGWEARAYVGRLLCIGAGYTRDIWAGA